MRSKEGLQSQIKGNKNQVFLKINPEFYPLEAIYGAAYVFLDRTYIRLDGDPKKEVSVFLKGKEKLTKRQLENLAGEFYNELLNYALRNKISEANRKIREVIVSQALLGAIGAVEEEELEVEGEEPEWKKDPLGIAVPWEEKYGKEEKNKKN